MGREEEREIQKAESLPWLRNDGARCSISMARSQGSREEESQGGELGKADRGKREDSGSRPWRERGLGWQRGEREGAWS